MYAIPMPIFFPILHILPYLVIFQHANFITAASAIVSEIRVPGKHNTIYAAYLAFNSSSFVRIGRV